jgi:hypothetical protein
MKKLLALFAILIFASTAFGQGSEGFEVWYGGEFTDFGDPGTWNNVMTVSPDKDIDIPVFALCLTDTSYIANFCLPLGINVDYVTTFNPGLCTLEYPLTAWDDCSFANGHCDPNCSNWPVVPNPGWCSLGIVGFADTGGGPNPWGYWYPNIGHIATFSAHTTADTSYIGDTVCVALGLGCDPYQPFNAGDTTGGAGWFVYDNYACLFFSPNQPPEIDPGGTFSMPYDCGYTDFTTTIDIFDNDGDALVVTVNYGTITLVATDQPGGPGTAATYTYEIDFDMEDFCGDCYIFDIVVTASDGINDPPTEFIFTGPFTIVGAVSAWMDDALYIWPGYEEWMPIYFNGCGDCFCMGGFEFTICFDVSVFTITDTWLNPMFAGGDIYDVSVDNENGFIHFFWLNNNIDQQGNEDVCGFESDVMILKFKVLLSPAYQYPDNFCIPICFCDDDDPYQAIAYNSVTDPTGYHTWFTLGCEDAPDSTEYGTLFLDLDCGNIKVMDEHNIVVGDLNLNGYPYEIGDVTLLANHLADPAGYPFTLRQMFASDVNGDGHQATIGDLIYMINMVNGFPGGKVMPLDVIATVSMPEEAFGNVDVRVNSEVSVGGAVVAINHEGVELGEPTANHDIVYNDDGKVLTVVAYNLNSDVLFTVPVIGEGALTFGDVQVSSDLGALLDARTEISAPIPTEFSVSQNFPNPFNARTKINFALPEAADVNVAIYNIAGQLVENIDAGYQPAGHRTVTWNASDVASGVYFYKVSAGDHSKTMKMTLLK